MLFYFIGLVVVYSVLQSLSSGHTNSYIHVFSFLLVYIIPLSSNLAITTRLFPASVPGVRVLPSSDVGSDDDVSTPLLPPPSPVPESSCNSSCDSEANQVSTNEWPGITTNSDDCSYSSDDLDNDRTDQDPDTLNDHPFAWEFGLSPSVMLTPSCAASDRGVFLQFSFTFFRPKIFRKRGS